MNLLSFVSFFFFFLFTCFCFVISFCFVYSRLPEALTFCLFSIQHPVSWNHQAQLQPQLHLCIPVVFSQLCDSSLPWYLSSISDFQLRGAQQLRGSRWSLFSLRRSAAVVERVHLTACSAESLYRGTDSYTGLYCVPVRKMCFYEKR